jgi:hypothetical protein
MNSELLTMLRFKLSVSADYIQPRFLQKANYINKLWTDEGEETPNFIDHFVSTWSNDNYNEFLSQVSAWTQNHVEESKKELWHCLRTLIMRDEKAYQRGTILGFVDRAAKDESVLCKQQENIQQLIDEIGEEDDVIIVNNTLFESSATQIEYLKGLSSAMYQHVSYLLNQNFPTYPTYLNVGDQVTKMLNLERAV